MTNNLGAWRLKAKVFAVAGMLKDPLKQVMLMCNHGVLVAGSSVADAYSRLYHFERAAGTFYSRAANRAAFAGAFR